MHIAAEHQSVEKKRNCTRHLVLTVSLLWWRMCIVQCVHSIYAAQPSQFGYRVKLNVINSVPLPLIDCTLAYHWILERFRLDDIQCGPVHTVRWAWAYIGPALISIISRNDVVAYCAIQNGIIHSMAPFPTHTKFRNKFHQRTHGARENWPTKSIARKLLNCVEVRGRALGTNECERSKSVVPK